MLAVSWDTVRLFLHVLAATVWVGGQLTLAASQVLDCAQHHTAAPPDVNRAEAPGRGPALPQPGALVPPHAWR